MIQSKPFSTGEFRQIYSRVPRLTIGVIIRTENGIVLSLRQLPSWKGQWHIPGGTVLYKESLVEAVRRVAHDELGVEVEVGNLLGYIEYPSEERERGFGWTVELDFLCSIQAGILRHNDQASEIRVFQKLPKNTIFEAKQFLKVALGMESE